ncbi:unnamed protein product, partial [Mesorhabditis belari]|uniref:Methylthioribose-1-phosphate isomerase n=1 Tax=Mesorhabditis belari TaxID=2138241 RepID=A0AAF3FPB0_9BILA
MKSIVNGPIPDDFMRDVSNRLNTLLFDKEKRELTVLDQLLLPLEKKYIPVRNVDEACAVIKSMQVRGAPLIAAVAILGLYLEINQKTLKDSAEFLHFLGEKSQQLIDTRPTAINLRNALNDLKACVLVSSVQTVQGKLASLNEKILEIYDGEQEENRRLVWNGYQEVISNCSHGKEKLTLLTICNTGSLATCSWGTALGVIVALHQAGRVENVYALETRPYNQGARLTTTELKHNGVPFMLITDSMAAWTMKTTKIDAILVGADQVALNGDTANKIGTYMLAVLANHHKVPFYPVVPYTTVNRSRENGDSIPIEERPPKEMLQANGVFVIPEDTPVWNPAFDVTPAELITKIITDFGNYPPKELKKAVEEFSQV